MSKKTFLNRNQGFTLIELLTVIFIIALLATAVIFSVTSSRKAGRDTKRVSDVNQIQIALENYNRVEGRYPVTLTTGQPLIGPSGGVVYMNKIPQNPPYDTTDCAFSNYEYVYNEEEKSYQLFFCLEDQTSDLSPGLKVAKPTGITSPASPPPPPEFICGENLVDTRDSKSYSTVQIGSQCWMAENFNFGVMVSSSVHPSDNSILEKHCYNNIESNCDIYGGLYTLREAMYYSFLEGGQGICPDGWHLPSDNDFKQLEMNLGMSQAQADGAWWRGTNQGSKIAGEYDLWWDVSLRSDPGFGSSGLNIIPAPISYFMWAGGPYGFSGAGGYAYILISANSNASYFRIISYARTDIDRTMSSSEDTYSVRCLKN
jgi:uncharacterized protein (TIGR02145 family)/prepilin-type N-terminal cleavage/methylation domain-containing protein